MKSINACLFKRRKLRAALLLFSLLFFGAGARKISAHGGEDHGDEKPKTSHAARGTISHSSRLGAYEVMLKHPILEPDAATVGRFFVTRFETNEAASGAVPAVEIEAASGAITEAIVEKTETGGSYRVKIPALPAGVYTIRAKLTYDGETDTATFSGVEVSREAAADAAGGASSWLSTILLFLLGAVFLGAFAGLFYLAWRTPGRERVGGGGESISA